jgi:hypothetical protein
MKARKKIQNTSKVSLKSVGVLGLFEDSHSHNRNLCGKCCNVISRRHSGPSGLDVILTQCRHLAVEFCSYTREVEINNIFLVFGRPIEAPNMPGAKFHPFFGAWVVLPKNPSWLEAL